MLPSLAREARIAAIREFGPTRTAEAVARIYRNYGPDALTDEMQQRMLDRLIADQMLSEKLATHNRALARAQSEIRGR